MKSKQLERNKKKLILIDYEYGKIDFSNVVLEFNLDVNFGKIIYKSYF